MPEAHRRARNGFLVQQVIQTGFAWERTIDKNSEAHLRRRWLTFFGGQYCRLSR